MPIEFEHPIVADIEIVDIEIDRRQMKKIWDVTSAANLQIHTANKEQFPRVNQLSIIQKTKLNARIKSALENQSVVVVHHGQFAIVLDAPQNAYYQIEEVEAFNVLSERNKSLTTKGLKGKPSASVSFEKDLAWINIYLDNNAFSHLLYGPDYPNEIPLIFEISNDQDTPVILFGLNPYAKNELFLEKSVA